MDALQSFGWRWTAPATFGDQTSPPQRKKFPPRFRQLRRFDFAGNDEVT
jgi:hypothetical protein